MRKLLLSGIILSGVLSAVTSVAEDRVSFGAGSGALYNGLGVNLGFIKNSDLKYVSLGCIAFGYSSSNGISADCGIGAGWMRSDILSENGKHGLGIHIGVTHNTHNTHNDRNDAEAFIGIPYAYFFRGMSAAGGNVGLTPILSQNNGKTRGGLLLNLGYQF